MMSLPDPGSPDLNSSEGSSWPTYSPLSFVVDVRAERRVARAQRLVVGSRGRPSQTRLSAGWRTPIATRRAGPPSSPARRPRTAASAALRRVPFYACSPPFPMDSGACRSRTGRSVHAAFSPSVSGGPVRRERESAWPLPCLLSPRSARVSCGAATLSSAFRGRRRGARSTTASDSSAAAERSR